MFGMCRVILDLIYFLNDTSSNSKFIINIWEDTFTMHKHSWALPYQMPEFKDQYEFIRPK